jgi:hypothetical protein
LLFAVFIEDNLHDLSRALYDEDSEATCRVAVDMMLIACKLHLIDHYPRILLRKDAKLHLVPPHPSYLTLGKL